MTEPEIKPQISRALSSLNTPWSIDRIIVDPELNSEFILACRSLGLTHPVSVLNRHLLNLRKASLLQRRSRAKRTSFSGENEYRFAAEIAVRVLERTTSYSLDDILCDPELVIEFDKLAAEISPGYSPLQYRWAALNLRKSKRLCPEILGRVVKSATVIRLSLTEIDTLTIPAQQGLYIFHEARETLYVGEAHHLRNRLKKHLDHSDNKGLARWLWENGSAGVFLELHTLPEDTSTAVRRALETEMIRSRNPKFNVKR